MNIATTYHQSSEARINDLLASNNPLLLRVLRVAVKKEGQCAVLFEEKKDLI